MCQFRAIASLYHWHSDEFPEILPLYLRDVALTYFQSVKVDIREKFDHEQAVSALKNRFGDRLDNQNIFAHAASQPETRSYTAGR